MIRPSHRNRLVSLRVKSAAIAALLAIFLNLLVPITHGLIASAEASEVLEICTQNGVELVRVQGDGVNFTAEGKACPACADCPLCWFGKENQAFLLDAVSNPLNLQVLRAEPLEDVAALASSRLMWQRPATRAPPLT